MAAVVSVTTTTATTTAAAAAAAVAAAILSSRRKSPHAALASLLPILREGLVDQLGQLPQAPPLVGPDANGSEGGTRAGHIGHVETIDGPYFAGEWERSREHRWRYTEIERQRRNADERRPRG